ncbi:hypothetical protein PCYB_012620 [Plasmodium cynomolgi strain B]|uniref:Uncharacterized protein n=1 Tax=Plasmodium cynomolgi (strain B) TaxID=1120755 RepID=K6UPK2_PLACD|nr:hypothetical protein PCYB_012620 [Plasmodium cynomolgi strain B]GAB64529.1 hypothetical protein PCYB_012620 [Plasmodium cynomolgi strain B]
MTKVKKYPFEEVIRLFTFAKLSTFVLLIWIYHYCDKGYVNQSLNPNDGNTDALLFPCTNRLLAKYERGKNLKTVKLNQKTSTYGKKKKVTNKGGYNSESETDSHFDYDEYSDKLSVYSSRKGKSSGESELLCGQIFPCVDRRGFCCSCESLICRNSCRTCPKRKCSRRSPIYYIILGLLLILGVVCAIPAIVTGTAPSSLHPLAVILVKFFSLGIFFILVMSSKWK